MIRKTQSKDIEKLMPIFSAAKERLRQRGVDQWQDGYPDRDIIAADVENGESYILTDEKDIGATAVISFRGEPTYDVITGGQWLTGENTSYAVIHRIAAAQGEVRRGAATKLLCYAQELCRQRKIGSIRMDTHKDNDVMQQWLLKNGFIYCREITLSDGALRIAFEKVINE